MLFEIFCRLCCESAAKCKSVSKHWLSLISHLYFIPGYIRHHHQTSGNATQPCTLLLEHFGNIVVVPSEMDKKIGVKVVDLLKFLPPTSELHIEAAFNDLLLVCSNDLRFWLKNTSVFDYYICNPYTKHWLTFPRLLPMTFASTPLVGFICYANFRYKVVRIHCPSKSSSANNNTTMLRVEIFSSKTGEWCTSFVASPPELNRFSQSTMQHPVVACNGMLHWLDIDVYSKTRRNKGIVVLNPQGCHLCYISICPSFLVVVSSPWECSMGVFWYSKIIYSGALAIADFHLVIVLIAPAMIWIFLFGNLGITLMQAHGHWSTQFTSGTYFRISYFQNERGGPPMACEIHSLPPQWWRYQGRN